MKHNDCPSPRYLALIRPFVGQVTSYFFCAKKAIEQQNSINGCDHSNQVWALVLASLLLLTATFFIISKLEEKVFLIISFH